MTQVVHEALQALGSQSEIDLALAVALKKSKRQAIPTDLTAMKAFLYGPLLDALQEFFDHYAARPAVDHLRNEIERWANETEENDDASAVRRKQQTVTVEVGSVSKQRREGSASGPLTTESSQSNAAVIAPQEGSNASRPDATGVVPRKRERKASAVSQELNAVGHRDFGAELRARKASETQVTAAKPGASASSAKHNAVHPTAAYAGAQQPEERATAPQKLPEVVIKSTSGAGKNPAFDYDADDEMLDRVTAPPPGMKPAALRNPNEVDDDDDGPILEVDAMEVTSLRPKRRTVPTPLRNMPPVLVLSRKKELGLRLRAALRQQADVVVFATPDKLLKAADELQKLFPVVILDGREAESVDMVQEVLALAPPNMRLVMWGWSEEEWQVDENQESRRVRCDQSVEPEDLAALIQALLPHD